MKISIENMIISFASGAIGFAVSTVIAKNEAVGGIVGVSVILIAWATFSKQEKKERKSLGNNNDISSNIK